eukprot:6199559-Pleurochrysis_carterae.AAC.1
MYDLSAMRSPSWRGTCLRIVHVLGAVGTDKDSITQAPYQTPSPLPSLMLPDCPNSEGTSVIIRSVFYTVVINRSQAISAPPRYDTLPRPRPPFSRLRLPDAVPPSHLL